MLLGRRRTLRHLRPTHLPRVQAGMIYAQDEVCTRAVDEQTAAFLDRVDETCFRSRVNQGRREETCEWTNHERTRPVRLSVAAGVQ